ncbi:MAG: DUF485 domain-containing protein [Chloroflexota bacterium]|nr:DUF485 domain-containing protein [Chloroflexota bacterium]
MAGVAGGGKTQPKGDKGISPKELDKEHFYEEVEKRPEFQELQKAKARFIIPSTIFFITYYFALPILVGYFPDMMDTRVIGQINIAYLFALSQFFMAWILAFMYLKKATSVFDKLTAKIREQAAKLLAEKGA